MSEYADWKSLLDWLSKSRQPYAYCPSSEGSDTIVYQKFPESKVVALFQFEDDAKKYVGWLNGGENE